MLEDKPLPSLMILNPKDVWLETEKLKKDVKVVERVVERGVNVEWKKEVGVVKENQVLRGVRGGVNVVVQNQVDVKEDQVLKNKL